MTTGELPIKIAQLLYDKKAQNIVVLKVAHRTIVTEYMVIATGRTALQVKALAEEVEDHLAEMGEFVRRKEGHNHGRWIVLDYGSILVHVFHTMERAYYRLDQLWDDGGNRLALPFEQEPVEDEIVEDASRLHEDDALDEYDEFDEDNAPS